VSLIGTRSPPGQAAGLLDDGLEQPSPSQWGETARRVWRSVGARIGLAILLVFVVVALVAPLVVPYNVATDGDLSQRLQPPSSLHLMGTDGLGRDDLRRLIYGARISLRVGLVAVLIGASIGTTLGLITGFWGRVKIAGITLDDLIMRLIDIQLAFPGLLLAIAAVAMLGPSLDNTMLILGLLSPPAYARVMRSMVLSVAQRDFVVASRALGSSDLRLLLQHVFPNCLSPLIVQATLGIADTILAAAGLGFLGLGAVPPTPEWGAMMSDSLKYFQLAPYLIFFPGLAVMLTVLAFNLLGDGLRDALDPQLRS
jgi:peptide/nickel transport system permease protein